MILKVQIVLNFWENIKEKQLNRKKNILIWNNFILNNYKVKKMFLKKKFNFQKIKNKKNNRQKVYFLNKTIKQINQMNKFRI